MQNNKKKNNHLNEFELKYNALYEELRLVKQEGDFDLLKNAYDLLLEKLSCEKDMFGNWYINSILEISEIAVKEIGLGIKSVIGIFLDKTYRITKVPANTENYDEAIKTITHGLIKVSEFGEATDSAQAENYRKLLLNLAKDVRVILIKIAEHLFIMRKMKILSKEQQIKISYEASYLYAPLAHRLGLYNIKLEMEDLSLKFLDRKTYDVIARKLDETMRARKKFIDDFTEPVRTELEKQGFKFELYGRPKSIHSIWSKMKRKEVEFEDIYDLFAIRIILDGELKNEKADCWQVYSIVTDLYQPNPLRLRDWISIPKTNGYESLHITVVGKEGRWVEVQIRTRRMNEIAEKGFAAHWKYKGLEGDHGIDNWLDKVREILEAPETNTSDFIDDIKLSLYSKEIFVFTPKGELRKLPAGATILDFAYDIHTNLGAICSGAKVNRKNVPIRHVLQNGDKVEILTSKNQKPKIDWLTFVVTSKARKKIRQSLDDDKAKESENGKEIIKRRFKNWKIPYNDDNIRKLLKHFNITYAREFYYLVSIEKINISDIKDFFDLEETKETNVNIESATEVIESLEKKQGDVKEVFSKSEDYLIIDDKVSNIDYKLSKCCNPIFGDEIFGFVTISEGIKIHRVNCPNAARLLTKYGYRVVKARWTKVSGDAAFQVDIRITGEQKSNLLNSISDVISKDARISLRSIALDSNQGIFEGKLRIAVKDIEHLDWLIKRLSNLKGIYTVRREDSIRNF